MTKRAILLGLLGALFIAGPGFINDSYIRVNFIVDNHFPIIVFGALLILTAGINPLLSRIRPSWRFTSAELSVMVALMLAAGSIPGAGLMRSFTATLAMPAQIERTNAGWRKNEILKEAPPELLAGGGKYDPEIMDGYLTGLGQPGKPIGLSDVPWQKWKTPLLAWLPIILLIHIAVICLSLIVHRQWSSRERLRYPVATFASMLMETAPGKAVGGIFRNKLFWVGFLIVLSIRIVNGANKWFPEFPEIPLRFDFSIISGHYPALSGYYLRPVLFPAVIAFGYFLESNVAFSLGVSDFLYGFVVYALVSSGVDMSGSYMRGSVGGWHNFGSYVGFAVMLIYFGRHYYWRVFRSAATFRLHPEVEQSSVWAARILVVSSAACAGLFMKHGLDWPLAIAMVVLILMMFLVMSRVNVESGVFFYKPTWQAPAILIGLLGLTTLGPRMLVLIGLITAILSIDPRECLMPFIANGLKLADDNGVKPGRTSVALAITFTLALVLAVPVVLWAGYNYGIQHADGWSYKSVPSMPFDTANEAANTLTISGELEQVAAYSPLERLAHINPDSRFLWAAGLGMILIMGVTLLRLRYAWWPLHPIFFLVAGCWTVAVFSTSFFFGWMIKMAVTRFGGGRAYRNAMPLMAGVIGGDLMGGLLFMIIGTIYFKVTGQQPPRYWIFSHYN